MHWAVRRDGRDVEFVLGSKAIVSQATAFDHYVSETARSCPTSFDHYASDPEDGAFIGSDSPLDYHANEDPAIRFFLLNFNEARPITLDREDVGKAIAAYRDNDPYFPKPGRMTVEERSIWNASRLWRLTWQNLMR